MNTPELVTHAMVTVDLSQIKCIKHGYNKKGKNVLIIELKTRYEYIKNPETNKWKKQKYDDKIEMVFDCWEEADIHQKEWLEIWQNYLTRQSK